MEIIKRTKTEDQNTIEFKINDTYFRQVYKKGNGWGFKFIYKYPTKLAFDQFKNSKLIYGPQDNMCTDEGREIEFNLFKFEKDLRERKSATDVNYKGIRLCKTMGCPSEPNEFSDYCNDCYDQKYPGPMYMRQEKANKIFETDLGQQVDEIFVVSDGNVFIRRVEAENYCHDILEEGDDVSKFNITTWYSERK